MIPTNAYAAYSDSTPLAPYDFNRRAVKTDDVQIEILFCGVCHSDLHQARNEWSASQYPMVPGHEIVGKVVGIGKSVTKFKIGETVGVGVMVDSCRVCKNCQLQIVVNQGYVLHVSDKLDLKAVAPLLCAGITTYSPLIFAGVKKGTKVAIVGLGGLGHMAVKFAVSFGAEVTVLSTSPGKEKDAIGLGAKFALTTDASTMENLNNHFDIVLDAISANHDYTVYLNLLDTNGKLLVVGLPTESPKVAPFSLIGNRRSIIGSCIGGIRETQEMLDYCAKHNIVSDVELINMQDINKSYERMLKGDVKYRFVIDLSSMK